MYYVYNYITMYIIIYISFTVPRNVLLTSVWEGDLVILPFVPSVLYSGGEGSLVCLLHCSFICICRSWENC